MRDFGLNNAVRVGLLVRPGGWRNDNGTAPAGSNPPEPNCIPYVRGERSSKKVVGWRLKPAAGWLCARTTAGIGVNRCQFESGPGRYAHQSRLAKSSRAASRRRTIWKVFCGTRRPRLSATKGHAPEGACTCAGAFHAAFSGKGCSRSGLPPSRILTFRERLMNRLCGLSCWLA